MTILDEYVARSGNWLSLSGRTNISPRGATGKTVLLLVGEGPRTAGNLALETILAGAGWEVVIRRLSDAEDYTGIDVVVMQYGNPLEDNGQYVHPQVGVVGVDTWRPVGMGTLLGFSDTSNGVAEVVNAASDLAAGVTGTFDAYLSAAYINWETDLSESPDVIVSRPSQPGQAVVFAYEAGSQMPGRFATTRHVALGFHQDGFAAGLTAAAEAQVLAAVEWAEASAYVSPPAPSAPSGVSASGSDGSVRVSWTAPSGAETYTVKRALVTGGPYTVVQSGVTTTSYLDTGLSNDTTYYYVVSASNIVGESANSAEASATPAATSNLAMLATSAELTLWQTRSTSGPFQSTGDFANNSPGHWDEMNATMSINFSSQRWDGPATLTESGAVAIEGASGVGNSYENRTHLHDMMSAAYAALTTNTTSVPPDILTELEYYASRERLDYSNRTLWPYSYYDDLGPLFNHAISVKDLLLAYDICKAMGSSSSTVEDWFVALGDLTLQSVDDNMSAVFPNRSSGDYTSRASWVDETVDPHMKLADGSLVYYPRIMRFYQNRRNNLAGFAGLAGALTGNATLIAGFKRYAKEWVTFGHSLTGPNAGGFGDHNRGTTSFPQLGYSYSLHALESILPAMDALARQGDTELYDYASNDGSNAPTWGNSHPKTTESVIDLYVKWQMRTWPAHYAPVTATAGDSYYRVHSRNTSNDNEIVNDANLLLAANYYGRSDWQDAILRVGAPSGYTPSVQGVGAISGWRADWRQRFLRSLDANPYGGA